MQALTFALSLAQELHVEAAIGLPYSRMNLDQHGDSSLANEIFVIVRLASLVIQRI